MPRVAPPLQLSEDEVIALRNYSSTEHAQIVAELEHMKLENTKEPPYMKSSGMSVRKKTFTYTLKTYC